MSSWSLAGSTSANRSAQDVDAEIGAEESRIVRAAVALLRAEVAVLKAGARIVLAAADGVDPEESARRLADPVEALALGYRSQLSVPLWRDGRRIGALAVLGRNERDFDDADIALLRALAGCLDRAVCSIH
ncbi:GAF domain-containing protein [Sphingomonas pituitosa]|uniref:GAF domain-containing protein n=1 Tax=Sphingomonas pituitosa TaxID=99597 RepID=UPI0009FF3A65|nr:GAF domain-containing protein [Sphingomonas pituitosa]